MSTSAQSLRQIATRIAPSSFLDYREYLKDLYLTSKKEMGRYSYARFAEDLGFSPTNIIYQYIDGRRPLSLKDAGRITRMLDLKGIERRYFMNLVTLRNARSAENRDKSFETLLRLKSRLSPTPIDKDMIEYYRNWYHSVIREMVRMENFQSDPHWIASNIIPGLRPEQARESLEVLERLGMIRYDTTAGRHLPVQDDVSTGHEVSGLAVMNYHARMIDIGKAALTKVDPEKRDISVVTLCISRRRFEKLKSLIHQFQMELMAEDRDTEVRDQVVQVNLQLFPFTKEA